MTHSTRLSSLALLGITIFSVACMQSGDDAGAREALAALQDRDARHHDSSASIADVAGLRGETAVYSDDMGKLMEDMDEACDSMMGSGMMGASGSGSMHDSMRGMMDRMRIAVGDHRARMDALDDPEAMRKECDAHHEAMTGMLDGMGGMMGGHMGGMM